MDVGVKNGGPVWVPGGLLTGQVLTKTFGEVLAEESPIPRIVRDHSLTGTQRRQGALPGDGGLTACQESGNNDKEESSSSEETDRLDRRRFLNKMAAQRCRDRKKQQAELLSSEVLQLEAKNTELFHSVRKLKREREDLMNLLRTHCDVFHKGN